MTTYTVGPLLGMFFMALWGRGKGSVLGLVVGAVISFVLVIFVRTDVWVLFMNDGLAEALANLPTYQLVEGESKTIKPTLSSAWMWPITTFLTIGCGLLFPKRVV